MPLTPRGHGDANRDGHRQRRETDQDRALSLCDCNHAGREDHLRCQPIQHGDANHHRHQHVRDADLGLGRASRDPDRALNGRPSGASRSPPRSVIGLFGGTSHDACQQWSPPTARGAAVRGGIGGRLGFRSKAHNRWSGALAPWWDVSHRACLRGWWCRWLYPAGAVVVIEPSRQAAQPQAHRARLAGARGVRQGRVPRPDSSPSEGTGGL